jgi:hypothetical protein
MERDEMHPVKKSGDEKGDEKGHEKGDEKGYEKGDEKEKWWAGLTAAEKERIYSLYSEESLPSKTKTKTNLLERIPRDLLHLLGDALLFDREIPAKQAVRGFIGLATASRSLFRSLLLEAGPCATFLPKKEDRTAKQQEEKIQIHRPKKKMPCVPLSKSGSSSTTTTSEKNTLGSHAGQEKKDASSLSAEEIRRGMSFIYVKLWNQAEPLPTGEGCVPGRFPMRFFQVFVRRLIFRCDRRIMEATQKWINPDTGHPYPSDGIGGAGGPTGISPDLPLCYVEVSSKRKFDDQCRWVTLVRRDPRNVLAPITGHSLCEIDKLTGFICNSEHDYPRGSIFDRSPEGIFRASPIVGRIFLYMYGVNDLLKMGHPVALRYSEKKLILEKQLRSVTRQANRWGSNRKKQLFLERWDESRDRRNSLLQKRSHDLAFG